MTSKFLSYRSKHGLTLIECLVSIMLLSTLLVSILASFFIARLATEHARHRRIAANLLTRYMEREVLEAKEHGYDLAGDTDLYYTYSNGSPQTTTVAGINYSVTPDPYPARQLIYTYESVNHAFKVVGFLVSWMEEVYGQGGGLNCSERAVTYISDH